MITARATLRQELASSGAALSPGFTVPLRRKRRSVSWGRGAAERNRI